LVERMIGPEPPAKAEPKPNGLAVHAKMACKASCKPKSAAAYHALRRASRDRDDQALIEAMRSNPEGLISDWATTIGKGRSGLAESVEGKWRLTEEPAPREPPPKRTAPLSAAAREHRAHA
jgi:hypothetical protein